MDVGSPSHRETKWLRDLLRLSLRKLQPPRPALDGNCISSKTWESPYMGRLSDESSYSLLLMGPWPVSELSGRPTMTASSLLPRPSVSVPSSSQPVHG